MRAGFNLGSNKRVAVALNNEKGFIEIQIMLTYMVFALTMFAFILGLFFGAYKQAQAKYLWFTEALDFAARAANITGSLEEVELNQNKAEQYFRFAMEETGSDYTLKSFYTVDTGEPVPKGTAQAPGYVAEIVVPVFEGQVPLIGKQRVEIPMRYFAVVKSPMYQ